MPPDLAQQARHIERIFRVDVGHNCPFHVAAAVLVPDVRGVKRVVSGAGLSEQHAITNCLFEAIERQGAIFGEPADTIRSSALALGEQAIDPHALLLISDAQYAAAEDWNRDVSAVHRFPQRFDPHQAINWVRASSLTNKGDKYVPTAHCFLGYPLAMAEGFPVPDSSGLSTGETLDDAAERGLLELIERDAVSIWWYNQLPKQSLRFDCEKLPFWDAFQDWTTAEQRQSWILDLSTDFPLSVAAAVSCDQRGYNLSFGFGAAMSPEQAAQSAIREMVQFEATKRLRNRGDANTPDDFVSWCWSSNAAKYPFLLPQHLDHHSNHRETNYPKTVLEAVKDLNFEALLLDLSEGRPGMQVARVIVPGLRPIWPRFASGRLYDVPVRLGWRKQRLLETELNPVHILY
jgi:oxazoline/thiazoline synthase